MIPELEDPALRELIVGQNRLLFMLEKNIAYMLAVRHAKRRFPYRLLNLRKGRIT